MFLSEESKRRKIRIVGDIRSFMTRHGMGNTKFGELIECHNTTISNWMNGHSAPHLCDFEKIRERMKGYDREHPITPPSTTMQQSLLKNDSGVSITIQGGAGGSTLSFQKTISLEQAGSIISHLSK